MIRILACLVIAATLSGCKAEQTEEGKMPDVDVNVEGGKMPEYDVKTPTVEVNQDTTTVITPDVDVKAPQ
jgi:hypothetical protein